MSRRRDVMRRSSAALMGLIVSVAIAAVVGGCSTAQPVRSRDTVGLTLAVPSGTPARVETFNGGIEVSTTSSPEITASVVRTGEGSDEQAAAADRDAIEVTLELVDGVAFLHAVYTPSPDSISGGRGAAVKLRVPSTTSLELATSNGPITVHDTTGGLTAQTSNGPVNLAGVSGTLAVATSNGPVKVSTNAPVALDLHTSNGGITFDGSLQQGQATIEASNGPVELRLPADAAFTIDASTSNGKITSDFQVEGTASDGALKGTAGSPEDAATTDVTVRTSNGPITLKQD
jgi:DUF4097 and DUF4098 domain-containing protein YvlB